MTNNSKAQFDMKENLSNVELDPDNSSIIVSDDGVAVEEEEKRSDDVYITRPFDPTKIRVDTKPTTMDVLIKRLKSGSIDLSPGFQRKGGIWNEGTKSRLIESMLIRIPLPAFYIDATDDDNWLVVDGLQRLTAIKRFIVEKSMPLTGLEFLSDYNDEYYDNLPDNFKRRIEETDIVLYLIQPGTPDRVKYDIFSRINTGGLPLSSQEIRHALNQGPISELLEKLANSQKFQLATCRGVAAKRMDDRECVLRFFAFCLTLPEDYKGDGFDGFLNSTMARLNKMSSDERDILGERFLRAMGAAHEIFNRDAFRKRYEEFGPRHPVNKALFEAWSVNLDALSDHDLDRLIKNKEDLKANFLLIMNLDQEFISAISQGTGSISRIKKRFSTIKHLIRAILDEAI